MYVLDGGLSYVNVNTQVVAYTSIPNLMNAGMEVPYLLYLWNALIIGMQNFN